MPRAGDRRVPDRRGRSRTIGRPTPRRALTLLEVVLATAMLGLIAGAIFGVTGSITAGQVRQQRRLAAAELANRLVLSYLDDPTRMPSPSAPLTHAGERYRYEYTVDPVRFDEVGAEVRQSHASLGLDRFELVTVRVWFEAGSRDNPITVTLRRMLDPLYIRNPDSGKNLINSPEAWQKLIEQMSRMTREAGPGTPAPAGASELVRGRTGRRSRAHAPGIGGGGGRR